MTKIEWTEATWNPIVGCSIASPGCTNCYAMKQANRLLDKPGSHYHGTTTRVNDNAVWTGKVALAPDHILYAPLKRKKPTTYFVNSMGDLFHENAPDELIDQVFEVMALCPRHTFQVLTKRADRMLEYCKKNRKIPLTNVWLGVSVENQESVDSRIPLLLQTPAAKRFVSAEPLLGPVSFRWMCAFPENAPFTAQNPSGKTDHLDGLRKLDWIITGGESGPKARPMHPEWVNTICNECHEANIAFFFKQWGGKDKKQAGNLLNGKTYQEMPA